MYMFKIYDDSLHKYVFIQLSDLVRDNYGTVTNEKIQKSQDISMDLTKCKDEKLKLQAVVADLTQVNRRWQRYNSDMQAYIKKLQATIEEQQEQLNNMADIKAEQLIFSSKDSERGDKLCLKCLPLVRSLRSRIGFLDSELCKQSTELREANQHVELLNLQMRLRQAQSHIEDLNSSLLTSGLLKKSYSKQPYSSQSRMPCSLDGHTFYECDSGSSEDLDILSLTPKGIRMTNKEALIPSTSEVESSSSTSFTDTLEDKKRESSSPKEISKGESSKMFTESHYTFNILCSPKDSFIDVDNKSVNINPIIHDIDESNVDFDYPLEDHSNFINNSGNHFECTNKDALKATRFSTLWNFTDRYKFCKDVGMDVNSIQTDITCPHCLTVFPPGSEDSYKNHTISCQFL